MVIKVKKIEITRNIKSNVSSKKDILQGERNANLFDRLPSKSKEI